MPGHSQIITHKGHKIICTVNSGLKTDEIIANFPTIEKMAFENQITLFCTDITNTVTDDAIKKAGAESVARIVAKLGAFHSAIVGLRGIQKILANAMVRGQYFASDKEDALEWLVKQAGK